MTNVSLSQWQVAQEHEQNFWASYADTYERYPQILLDHLAKLRDVGEYPRDELHAPEVKDTLEVGVGPLGIGVLGMQASTFRITAIDPLPRIRLEFSDAALDAYIQALREKVAYRCSQGETLPFEDNRYDFVCCHNVIDHSQKPLSILEEIFRVLKNQSCLYLTLNTFSYFGKLKFEGLRRLRSDRMIFACHPHSFLHADVLKALSNIGYEIVRHAGGHDAIIGRGRLSKILCKKQI